MHSTSSPSRRPSSLLLAVALAASTTPLGCSSQDGPAASTNVTVPASPASSDPAKASPSTSPDAPFTGSVGVWSWTGIDGMRCGNGEPTGVGVSLGASDRVLVFFEGGGACWNGLTCFAAKTATFIESGFGSADLEARLAEAPGSVFDRGLADNAFKDDTFVYVPYCTGDVHAGSRTSTYDANPPVHHVGLTNAELVVRRMRASFRGKASRVFLTGSSAGGFGSAILYGRFAEAFAPIRVDLVDDSGPPIPAAKSVYLAQWDASWNLFAAFPAECEACRGEPAAVIPYFARRYPGARFGLLSYDRDGTISRFFGLDGDAFQAALDDISTAQLGTLANARTFIASGTDHTMLGKVATRSGGVALSSWLTQMTTDDAGWKSVTPGAAP